jgi:hypothetical protein
VHSVANVPESLRRALADRYRLDREVGRGGMATVYLARDLKHDRDVALKVLHSELAASLGAERFLREIRVTATLQHPHILPLFDSGEAGGVLYYVMPYVEGGSLRERLRREGPLPRDAMLTLIRQVAAALDYAHGRGVIHRDIKPENILLHRNEAVVADFGIARAVASASAREALTRSGFPLGTPGYMSPEQASGSQRLDGRTDVFALACVAYEMLVGEPPEMWPMDDAARLGRFLEVSARHRERLDRLPGRLEQVLVRALAMRPQDRFPSACAFADALAAVAEPSALLPEAEVRRVLDRAAELQRDQPTSSGALTMGQVEQIAAEVGIEPAYVRAAVAKPIVEPGDKQLRVVREARCEATAADLEHVAATIQNHLGLPGHVSIFGGSLTWSPAIQGEGSRQIVVTVAPIGGRTEIRIEERIDLTGHLFFAPPVGAAAGGLLGLGFGSLASLLLGDPGVLMVLFAAVCAVGGGVTAASIIVATLRGRREPQLVALADELAALLERGRLPPGGSSR